LIRNEKPTVLFEKTAKQLRSQRPLHVQGDAGHPGKQGGGHKKNGWKNKEKERHMGLLTPKESA
jgi:hypothetical protein